MRATNKNKECRRKVWNSAAIAAAVAAVLWAAPVAVFGAASFVSSAQNPDKSAKLRAGEIIVWPASHEVPLKVDSGLIHDWIGAAFIPDTTLREILAVLRWIIDPIVRRVSRSSLATSLRQTESAVRLYSASAMTTFNKSSAAGIVGPFR